MTSGRRPSSRRDRRRTTPRPPPPDDASEEEVREWTQEFLDWERDRRHDRRRTLTGDSEGDSSPTRQAEIEHALDTEEYNEIREESERDSKTAVQKDIEELRQTQPPTKKIRSSSLSRLPRPTCANERMDEKIKKTTDRAAAARAAAPAAARAAAAPALHPPAAAETSGQLAWDEFLGAV